MNQTTVHNVQAGRPSSSGRIGTEGNSRLNDSCHRACIRALGLELNVQTMYKPGFPQHRSPQTQIGYTNRRKDLCGLASNVFSLKWGLLHPSCFHIQIRIGLNALGSHNVKGTHQRLTYALFQTNATNIPLHSRITYLQDCYHIFGADNDIPTVAVLLQLGLMEKSRDKDELTCNIEDLEKEFLEFKSATAKSSMGGVIKDGVFRENQKFNSKNSKQPESRCATAKLALMQRITTFVPTANGSQTQVIEGDPHFYISDRNENVLAGGETSQSLPFHSYSDDSNGFQLPEVFDPCSPAQQLAAATQILGNNTCFVDSLGNLCFVDAFGNTHFMDALGNTYCSRTDGLTFCRSKNGRIYVYDLDGCLKYELANDDSGEWFFYGHAIM
ncbi:hypothetical protein BC936DRAFT_146460 [Jimgerdemannia flammicorona]|uniref:Uncharacterized protein n=1 Tax=Jimgerdemannia flammicorona TaxID=994334 RepID=A0A433D7J4_9FUNG|nr:hypothetical protein BC936DRAFT_146460 [Jimgerdemannia flammicorona]